MSPRYSSLRLAVSLLVVLSPTIGLCSGQSLFQATQVVNPDAEGTNAIVTGHFNADTHLDFTVSTGNSRISVFLGNGNGTFNYVGFYGAGSGPYGLTVGDFNGDTKKDLAVANELGNSVSILLGSGTGTFTTQPEIPAGDTPRYLVAADLNGDGKADLAAANQFSDNVSVLLGNGNGTFQPQVTYPVDLLPRGIVSADFNSDSKPDLAVATRTGASLSLLIGNGDGTFQPQIVLPINNLGRPSPLVTGDFDADGKADLVVGADASRSVSVNLGHGDGSFDPSIQYLTSPQMGSPVDIAKGNFNGDGAPDLVSAEYFTNIASVLLGVGNGSFAPHLTFPSGFTNPIAPIAVATGDFNSDGFDDVVLGRES
ncbi:MAG TPA: VCBS repeat-containing protein, partial [Candidatus Polarisedimenticolia bacterium]|nr:VCBS repeat-containing protein [Candidatus Polarisedimenticolia bacterium]